jgi:streptomycin 6-kinase
MEETRQHPVVSGDVAARAFEAWGLAADGEAFSTPSSSLHPVRWRGRAAMLKVITHSDERNGAAALAWFAGRGAVRVLAMEADAVLMERAGGAGSLVEMVGRGEDDAATRIICSVVQALHAPRAAPPPAALTPLTARFRALFEAAAAPGASAHYVEAAGVARRLLARPLNQVVLHGDIHHENILLDETRGWLAIDPKGLIGEATYDYANTLENPFRLPQVVLAKGRLRRQAEIVAETAEIDLRRLLEFTFAFAALSECWGVEDGNATGYALRVSKIARDELAQM